jgi:hypothetical protein
MLLCLHICFKQFVDLNHCVTEEHYYLRKNAMSTVKQKTFQLIIVVSVFGEAPRDCMLSCSILIY